MNDLQLGTPIAIDGREVIVVRDLIGRNALSTTRENEIYTLLEPAAADGRPAIYISEDELKSLRENFPGADVYGLWQLLFANDAVPLGEQLTVFRTSSTTGQYLQLETGTDYTNPANIVHSSEFIANYLTDLHDYDLNDAAQVEVRVEDLILPSRPAYLRVETAERMKHEIRNRWYVSGAICLAIAIAAGVYMYATNTIYKMNMADYAAKRIQVDELNNRISALLSERLEVVPNDSAALSTILQLVSMDRGLRTQDDSTVNTFMGNHTLLTSPRLPVDLGKRVSGVKSEVMPDLSYKLTFKFDLGVQN